MMLNKQHFSMPMQIQVQQCTKMYIPDEMLALGGSMTAEEQKEYVIVQLENNMYSNVWMQPYTSLTSSTVETSPMTLGSASVSDLAHACCSKWMKMLPS